MQSKRPTSILVLTIFHFILAGLGIILGLVTILGTVFVSAMSRSPAPAGGGAMSPMVQYQYLDVHLPYWKEADIAFAALYLVISFLMIVAGVGLILMKPWGRLLSLGYGVVSIASQAVRMAYMFAFFLPAMMGFYDSLAGGSGGPPPGVVAGMKVGMTVGLAFALLGLVYPVIVLIFMMRPAVKAAFSAAHDGADEEFAADDRGRPEDRDHGRLPRGYDDEPDDRIGPAPR